MRQLRAAHSQRTRRLEHASERDRILRDRLTKGKIDPKADDAYEQAAGFVLRHTVLRNVALEVIGDRLWIGESRGQNGIKHQAGFGLRALEACVNAWDGDFLWDPEHPSDEVMISVRDWLEPVERWSWDIRRTGAMPDGQPSFW
ncbi:MAG: hypothetical protein AAGC46_13585 [Solirubrobacteraceae bacterium]|nr:hypothetical protein [Patulibacter sp.]